MTSRKAGKWNYERQAYDQVTIPEGAVTSAYLSDVVQCAQCGRKITYGAAYTSLEIQTPHGMGFSVCRDCYDDELAREDKYLKGKGRRR